MLYGVAVLSAIFSFVLGMITSVKSCFIKSYVSRLGFHTKLILLFSAYQLPHLAPLVTAWLSIQVAVDTFITSAVVYYNVHNITVLIHNRQLHW